MHLVVSYLQYTESPVFSPVFADGLHDWGILLVIPLGFQERKPQPFLWHSQNKKLPVRPTGGGIRKEYYDVRLMPGRDSWLGCG